jgi:hypothetical protein
MSRFEEDEEDDTAAPTFARGPSDYERARRNSLFAPFLEDFFSEVPQRRSSVAAEPEASSPREEEEGASFFY